MWGRPLAGARAEAAAARAEVESWRGKEVLARLAATEAAAELRAAKGRVDALDTVEADRLALAGRVGAFEAERAERERAHTADLARTNENFAALAAKALESAQAQFLERAEARFAEHQTLSEGGMKALLTPVAETLQRYEGELKLIEASRQEAYGGLKEQLVGLAAGQLQVSAEASRLINALRSSGKTSGSWGEQQLRNTLEMAGLREGIDFTVQTHAGGEDGGKRPDAIVNLPGGRRLIVDAKCSLNDYLSAAEADSEDGRRAAYKRHAAAVRTHARGLSDKSYWKEFGESADFVVMFLPGENFLSAALEHDLPLLGWAFDQRVLLTGPINLLALAKTVALVWRQEKLAQEAKEIGKLGADLHAAIATMAEHLSGIGKNLSQAVNGYNSFVGSLEANVLPKARRFTELGVEEGKKAVPTLGVIDTSVRTPAAPELRLAPPTSGAANDAPANDAPANDAPANDERD
ncbi:DNA recombination protein RmuC [Sphingosinicellaceae bacterium]|nr:DNA recombination protein RmuC [Sphingosinicellaceae bacterium]